MTVLDLKMRNLLAYFLLIIAFTSCEKNQEVISEYWWHNADVVELNASEYSLNFSDTSATGSFIKFNFSKGDTVSHENWDVAFRGTTLIVNGGEKAHNDQPNRTGSAAVYIANGIMSEINSVDTNRLLQDNASGSAIFENIKIDDLGLPGDGWAEYNWNAHIISPRQNIVLVFRTHDKKYAKMDILYFYDNPNPPSTSEDIGGFYTFNYVYQDDGGTEF